MESQFKGHFEPGSRYDNDLGVFNPDLYLKIGYPTPHYNQNFLIQPRFGFTYDPTGARKTVIRVEAGLFYSYNNANWTIDDWIFNDQTTPSPALSPTAANPIKLANPWNGVTGAQFLSGDVPVSVQAVELLDAHVRTTYSLQGSIGVQQQITRCNGPQNLDKFFPFLRWWAAWKMKESQCPERARVTRPA